MSACDACSTSIRTSYLGPYFNGALALVGNTLLFAHNGGGPSPDARSRNCTTEHRIEVRRLPACSTKRVAAPRRVATLTSATPRRICEDRLNFRGNGPEDARVMPLDERRAMLLYVDYVAAAGLPAAGYHRRIHARILDVVRGTETLGPVRELQPLSSTHNLSNIEKNCESGWVL